MRDVAHSAVAASTALCLVATTAAAQVSQLLVNPRSTTIEAASQLEGQAQRDALLLARFPSATWFTDGTPAIVEAKVRDLVERAAAEGKLPVLVAYNIPFRDCALYSAGGAANGAAYLNWIQGFAAGIGDREAIVILEPDGLGVIPWHRALSGEIERCRPAGGAEGGASAARFEQLRGAVDILSSRPRARIYLDGTTSSWLSPGDMASRLIKANVHKVAGFFLNVSNYESDARLGHYASWVSDCLALVMRGGLDPRECPSQYQPARFDDVSTWWKTDKAYRRLFVAARLRREPVTQKHAVIDTSRNGQGSWQPPAGKYGDAEVWCNPPRRGVGQRPTLDTGNPYVDAFLWIKVPGESDGQCYRGTAGPSDPERGMEAPAAGAWFAQQARELIELANPPLQPD
ncbi:glycoside hydrolase family 6 protein [Sphingomonas koreensis]